LSLAGWLSCGCVPQDYELADKLQHHDPRVRTRAAARAGKARDERAVPYLVDRLTDPENEVRMVAIISLERITGETMGYYYYEPPDRRAEAVRRWRQWLQNRRGGRTSTRPVEGEQT
jgi:HEAT repeat protein